MLDVELLLAPDCPSASAARAVLTECLNGLGLAVRVRERVGHFPSPTVLVDGVGLMTDLRGAPLMQACRPDVPTVPRLLAALHRHAASSAPDRGPEPARVDTEPPRPMVGAASTPGLTAENQSASV